MNKQLKVINLFGGPGVGKSTVAKLIAGKMYQHGGCEYIDEYAKELCWNKSNELRFKNQILISAQQYTKQLLLCENNIKLCVTDSPLLLGFIHQPKEYFASYAPLLFELFNSFDNINFLIKRGNFDYAQCGRNEDELQAKHKEIQLEYLLKSNNVQYVVVENNNAEETSNLIISLLTK